MTKIEAGQIWEDVARGGKVLVMEVKCSDGGDEYICFKVIEGHSFLHEEGQVVEGWSPDQFRRDHRIVEPEKCARPDYEALYCAAVDDRFDRGVALRNIRSRINGATLCNIASVGKEIREIVDRVLGE